MPDTAQLRLKWEQAFRNPSLEFLGNAKRITSQEKNRVRALEYFERFIRALFDGSAPREAQIIAEETPLMPQGEGAVPAAFEFLNLAVEGKLAKELEISLKSTFRSYWNSDQRRAERRTYPAAGIDQRYEFQRQAEEKRLLRARQRGV